MPCSSHRKEMPWSPQPFYHYLNCLQEEFECRSDDTLSPRRFNIYLGNLKGEFELMSLKIESLNKERDEYRGKGPDRIFTTMELEATAEVQVKKLQDARCNFICERCGLGSTSAPKTAVPSKWKPRKSNPPLFFRPFFKSQSLAKQGVSGDLTLEMPSRSTHHTTLFQRLYSIVTPTRPSQSDSQAIVNAPCPPPSLQVSAEPDSSPEQRELSIKFNNDIDKELDIEVAHTLYHGRVIACVKFSRDGKYLAAGCQDGKAYIYDVLAGTSICVLRKLLAGHVIRAVCFSHDGKYLATGSWEGEIHIWEITTRYVRNAFKGHTHCINSLDFSPNGRLLVSASDDNTVRLWNWRDGAATFLMEENPTFTEYPCYTSAVFSPDGLYVAASHSDGMTRIWSVPTGQLMRKVMALIGWTYHVAFMPDGKGLVTGGWDSKLKFWDIGSLDSSRLCARSQTTENSDRKGPGVEEQTQPDREFSGHDNLVYSLAVSPNGRWVASGSHDRSVRIWDGRNAATQCSLKHEDWIYSVDFSPAGCHLASGGKDGTLRIWRYSHITSEDC